MLKPPATKHLKLNCEILLSTFAFKFNLRRYAKDAKLIDPGEVLAACNTIDSCFKLFDADQSGEIDVEEMEQMQSLIGDFGEVLIKVGALLTTPVRYPKP